MNESLQQQRRRRLADAVAETGGGIAVISTGPEVMRNRDSDYPYRSDSYFYYLTAFPEPEACVVVIAADGDRPARSVLFCRPKNPEREIWDGFRHGPDAVCARFGFDAAYAIDELDAKMPELLADQPAIHYLLGYDGALDERVRCWLKAVRAKARSGVGAPVRLHDAAVLLDEFRLFKDKVELNTMRRAADISAQAHRRIMQVAAPGRHEYEIEAELLYYFRKKGAAGPAYGSIVAAGANACVLHYRANDQLLHAGDLLLVDAGCELDGYASDITRTIPISGQFSDVQADIYEIVLAAQQAAIAAIRPGAAFNDAHDAALRMLAQGLLELGVCTGSVDDVIESEAYKPFYMHRTSHWLGMDVHDCGRYQETAEPGASAAGASSRRLQPGMVLTVEPGLYIRPADDIPRAYWNIGVRIEDDIAVTPDGCEVLSAYAPKDRLEIEALMRDARTASSATK
ncbi:MAG: aminopeptidase P N-terminal domain-containing protein [Burkholderiaceae bacterium]